MPISFRNLDSSEEEKAFYELLLVVEIMLSIDIRVGDGFPNLDYVGVVELPMKGVEQ